MLWDAFTSASYQSLGKEALSGWKKKKHIFHPNCLAERKFRARSLPAVAWCWSLPQHERGCGDTHMWGCCHRTSRGHPAATSGRGSAWPRRLERGFVGIFHAPPRRKGWGWVWGCKTTPVALALLGSPSAGIRALEVYPRNVGCPPGGQHKTKPKC